MIMIKRFIILFVLLIPSLCFGAAFTSTQTGNWNDGGTYGNDSPGVAGTDYPANDGTDTITIADTHVVTLQQAEDILGIVLNAGATLDLDSYQLTIGASNFDANGTSTNRVTIKSTTVGGTFVGANNTDLTWDYTDFTDLGNWTGFLPAAGSAHVWDHCTFEDCGRIYFNNTWAHLDCSFTITNCDWKNPLSTCTDSQMLYIAFGTNEGTITGTRKIENCTFDGSVDGDATYKMMSHKGRTFQIKDSVFRNVCFDSTDVGDTKCFNNCFFFYSSISGNYALNLAELQEFDNHYIYTSDDNPHIFNAGYDSDSVTIRDNIIENIYSSYTDSGDTILLQGTQVNVYKNILIDAKSSAFVNALGSAKSGNVNCYRNTLVYGGGVGGYYGTLARNEGGGTFTGTTVDFHDNLVVNNNASSNNMAGIYFSETTIDQVTYTNYNNFYNFADVYNGVTMTGKTEGSHTDFADEDQAVDPSFVDDTLNLAKWDTSLGGAGTAVNAITEFLKLNKSDYDSDYNVPDLLTYVRAGFVPTNSNLDGAGKTGDDIGAIDFSVSSGSPASMMIGGF